MFLFSGRGLFAGRRHAAYDLLAYLEPGLLLDIGASNGAFTKLMLAKSPQSEVLAFEPFPGNITLLRENVGHDPRVTIFERAVTHKAEPVDFEVASTVATSTTGGKPGILQRAV